MLFMYYVLLICWANMFGCWDRGALRLTVNLRLINSLTYLLTYLQINMYACMYVWMYVCMYVYFFAKYFTIIRIVCLHYEIVLKRLCSNWYRFAQLQAQKLVFYRSTPSAEGQTRTRSGVASADARRFFSRGTSLNCWLAFLQFLCELTEIRKKSQGWCKQSLRIAAIVTQSFFSVSRSLETGSTYTIYEAWLTDAGEERNFGAVAAVAPPSGIWKAVSGILRIFFYFPIFTKVGKHT